MSSARCKINLLLSHVLSTILCFLQPAAIKTNLQSSYSLLPMATLSLYHLCNCWLCISEFLTYISSSPLLTSNHKVIIFESLAFLLISNVQFITMMPMLAVNSQLHRRKHWICANVGCDYLTFNSVNLSFKLP